MKSPHDMEQDDLAALVAHIQRELYLERDPERVFIWNPEKDLDCSAFVEILDELMGRHRLHPTSVKLKRPFVHRPQEVEFEEELSGPAAKRNPELAIHEGNLIGHLSPSMNLSDIVFAPTFSKIMLLKRRDVEDLRRLCDQMLEFMRD